MRWNNTRSLALGTTVVLTAIVATAVIAAPRNAGSKMRGEDFSFDQNTRARSYQTYRAPVMVESTPAPVVAQTPAPAATDNNAAPAPSTAQAPSSGTRRFSAEPSQNVGGGTTYYNRGRARSYGSSSRGNFSAGRKSLGNYLP